MGEVEYEAWCRDPEEWGIPGEPTGLDIYAENLKAQATDLRDYLDEVQRLTPEWDSDAADVFMELKATLPPRMELVAERFDAVADALIGYADELQGAQDDAHGAAEAGRTACEALQDAEDERAGAEEALDGGTVDDWLEANPGEAFLYSPTYEDDVLDAQGVVDDAWEDYQDAFERRWTAGETCAEAIDAVVDHDGTTSGLNDTDLDPGAGRPPLTRADIYLEDGARRRGNWLGQNHVLDFEEEIMQWSSYFDIDPALLALTLHHEGGNARSWGDAWREVEYQGYRAGRVDTVGMGQINPETAQVLLDDLWGIEMSQREIAEQLSFNDPFAIVMAAAALDDTRSRIDPEMQSRRNIFVGYALSSAGIENMNEVEWDPDALVAEHHPELDYSAVPRRAETHYDEANSYISALQGSVAESFGGGWHTQPDPPGSGGDIIVVSGEPQVV